MKEYNVKVTRQAYEHLSNIKRYIQYELSAPEAAANMVKMLKKAVKSLAFMPSRIKLTDEEPWHSENIRRMHVRNFFVYFWIDEANSIVHIIAVIYAARDQKTIFEFIETEEYK